jgi:hypothetical protein
MGLSDAPNGEDAADEMQDGAGPAADEEVEAGSLVLSSLCFGVMLDGVTPPALEDMAEVQLFGNVAILTDGGLVAVAKGGAAPETEQVLACSGLVQSEVCKVRVRDVHGEVRETDGVITINEAEEGDVDEDMSIAFTIPAGVADDGFEGLDPEETGTPLFFVDVSLDGMHYDESPEAILRIRLA